MALVEQDGASDDELRSAIVDFPNFLLCALHAATGKSVPLDDKRLLDAFMEHRPDARAFILVPARILVGVRPLRGAPLGRQMEPEGTQVFRRAWELHTCEQHTGVLDEPARQSLKLFQAVKNLPKDGMMTTPTLNALGIPALR